MYLSCFSTAEHRCRRTDEDFSSAPLMQGVGCQACNGSGFRGRIGVFEVLELDEAMVEAMRTGDPQAFAVAAKASPKFIPLYELVLFYLRQGMTTIKEVEKLVEDTGPDKDHEQ